MSSDIAHSTAFWARTNRWKESGGQYLAGAMIHNDFSVIPLARCRKKVDYERCLEAVMEHLMSAGKVPTQTGLSLQYGTITVSKD